MPGHGQAMIRRSASAAKPRKDAVLLDREALQKGQGQRHHVLRSGPERRKVDRQHVQPVEEIGAEAAGVDLDERIAVGGADDPDIDAG